MSETLSEKSYQAQLLPCDYRRKKYGIRLTSRANGHPLQKGWEDQCKKTCIYSLHSQGKLPFELSKDSNDRLIIDKEAIEKYDQLVKDCTPDPSEMACECGLMSKTQCSNPYTLTDDMVHCNTCDGRFHPGCGGLLKTLENANRFQCAFCHYNSCGYYGNYYESSPFNDR
jgi:hypothetical protein